jgi:F-type H+-transporting ATPase subunit b
LKLFRLTLRNSHKVLPALVLAALLSGAAASQRALAQEATPAAQAAHPGQNGADAAIEKVGSNETTAEDEDVFRHTPMVRSIAKALHMGVDRTALLFELINFAIIFFGIAIPLARIMPRMLRKRTETLKQDLSSARKATDEAKSRLSAVEAKLASLDTEIAAIRAQVEDEAKNDEARIKAAIGEESTRIVAAAEQEIASAAAQARRGLRTFAAELAIEQAAKQMVLTAETDRALIAEFLGDVTKGGLN